MILLDRNGNKIEIGDLLFYTERPISNYADSMVKFNEVDGDILCETLVVHYRNEYISIDDDNQISIKYSTMRDGRLVDYELIKDQTIKNNTASELIAYMNENYPLSKSKWLSQKVSTNR